MCGVINSSRQCFSRREENRPCRNKFCLYVEIIADFIVSRFDTILRWSIRPSSFIIRLHEGFQHSAAQRNAIRGNELNVNLIRKRNCARRCGNTRVYPASCSPHPSTDCSPILEGESAIRSFREKRSLREIRIDFEQDFSFERFHYFFFFVLFFFSLSPVIAAIYYNRGIIAKVRYFKYHTLGGIGGGNSRPWYVATRHQRAGCILSAFLASFSIVFVIDKNLSLFRVVEKHFPCTLWR